MWIVEEIIKKFEDNWKDWTKPLEGGRALLLRGENESKKKSSKSSSGMTESIYREENLAEVRQLLAQKLITMKPYTDGDDWIEYDYYPRKIHYNLKHMPEFYALAQKKPKWERIQEQSEELSLIAQKVKSAWISSWLADEKQNIECGLKSAILSENQREARRKLYRCLVGLNELEQIAEAEGNVSSLYHRVFSKRYLGNSKTFENELKSTVIGIARNYHPEVVKDKDTMDDVDVLEQLHLELYSQELTLKGSLRLRLNGPDGSEKELDTADYPYGLVLNQRTLSHVSICEEQTIHRVLLIENKANFMAEAYESGKLVIFTHGYITPMERKFLICLREILDRQQETVTDLLKEDEGTEFSKSPVVYQHSGDLDFGGICIYRYLREKVFPQLTPHRMDIITYEACLAAGMAEPITEEMAGKLKKLTEDPQLGQLAARLAADHMVVEQEAYL